MKLEKKHYIIIGVVIAAIAIWYFFLRKKEKESSWNPALGIKPAYPTVGDPINPSNPTGETSPSGPFTTGPGTSVGGVNCAAITGDCFDKAFSQYQLDMGGKNGGLAKIHAVKRFNQNLVTCNCSSHGSESGFDDSLILHLPRGCNMKVNNCFNTYFEQYKGQANSLFPKIRQVAHRNFRNSMIKCGCVKK